MAKPKISYVVASLSTVEKCLLPFMLNETPYEIATVATQGDDHKDFFSVEVWESIGNLDCQVLNEAVNAASERGATHAVIMLGQCNEFLHFLGKGKNRVLEENDIRPFFEETIALMTAFNCEAGGINTVKQIGLSGIYPFSTVRAPSPYVIIVDVAKFCGFRDLPFPFVVYDYFLRVMYRDKCVIRNNRLGTPLPEIDIDRDDYKSFVEMWYPGTIKTSKVTIDKQLRSAIDFGTPLVGL